MEIIEVLKELNIVDNSEALIDELVGAISLDPVSIKNLAKKTCNTPLYFRDAWYWSKFKAFIYGVKDIQDNLGEGVSISAKLFGSDKDKKRNGTRLLAELEKIDTSEKMKYILNATKSLLMGLIDNSLYFRIIDVIADTLPEDLEYFSSIAITTCTYSGSLQINTLQRKGLLMQAGIDANVDIEKQENIVTELGRKLDCYALSLDNEEHWKWHKEHDETSAGNYSVAPNIAIGVR